MPSVLVLDARGRWRIVIAGDLNAWVEWGRTMNVRERVLLEAFIEVDMVLANVGIS